MQNITVRCFEVRCNLSVNLFRTIDRFLVKATKCQPGLTAQDSGSKLRDSIRKMNRPSVLRVSIMRGIHGFSFEDIIIFDSWVVAYLRRGQTNRDEVEDCSTW
jgi:hypothetical protein